MNTDRLKGEGRAIELSSGLLARNTLLTLIGQAMPLLVGGSYHPLYHAGLGRSALVRRVQDGEGEV